MQVPAIIGRASGVDLRLDDPGVSRRHAEIDMVGGQIQLTDLGSANGVYVNGRKISGPVILSSGDLLTLGSTKLMVSFLMDEPETETIILHSIPSEETLHIDSKRLQVLYKIAVGMAEYEDVDQLLENFFTALSGLLSFDRHFLVTIDDDGDFSVLYPTGESRVPLSTTIAEKVLVTGQTLLLRDAMTDTAFSGHESIVAFGIHSAICAPLRFRNRIFGFVYLDRDITDSFSMEDMKLVRAATFIIGPILENIRLREAIEERYQKTLSHLKKTEARLIDMERLAAFASLARSVAHEIRNPLMIAGGLMERLRPGLTGEGREKITTALRAIGKIDLILREVDSFVSNRSIEKKIVNIESMLQDYFEGMGPEFEKRGIHYHFCRSDKHYLCMVDERLFRQALDLIFKDVLERPPRDRVISICTGQSNGNVELCFGQVQEDSVLAEPFDERTVRKPWSFGLFLNMAYKIIVDHGGRMFLNTGANTALPMKIVLPLYV